MCKDQLINFLQSPDRVKLLEESGILKILPEVMTLQDCTQNSENTYIHTMKALKSIEGKTVSLECALAILLHDIGKPATRTENDGLIHFYDHDHIGGQMCYDILHRLKFSNKTINKVTWLVANHMQSHYFPQMKKSKKIALIEHKYFNDLLILMQADIAGGTERLSDLNIPNFIKKHNL